jgi:anti-sigma-K factor RskA
VNPSPDHRELEQDLGAYLLGALTAEETRRFEAHMESCDHCRVEVRWLQAAADVLPVSVEQLEPPPELRERLLDTVRDEAVSEQLRPRPAGRRWPTLSWRPAVALAALAIAAAGIAGYALGEEDQEVRTVAASPTGVVPGASASVVRTGDTALLRAERLPLQRRGRVYQVWLRRQGSERIEPSSTFVVGENGRGATTIPQGLDEVAQVMVSQEPNGGSRQPTTKPVLVANL